MPWFHWHCANVTLGFYLKGSHVFMILEELRLQTWWLNEMHLFITLSWVSEPFLVGTTAKTKQYLLRCLFKKIFIFVRKKCVFFTACASSTCSIPNYLHILSVSQFSFSYKILYVDAHSSFLHFHFELLLSLALEKLQLPLKECLFAEIVKHDWILEAVPGKGVLSSKTLIFFLNNWL